jgi:hypothetical protein
MTGRKPAGVRCTYGLFLAAALPFAAVAQDFSYGLELGIAYSDNPSRTVGGGDSSAVGLFGIDANIDREGPRLDANADIDLQLREYLRSGIDTEIRGRADGDLAVHIIEDRLDWVYEQSFGQARANVLAGDSPDNAQNVNYIVTGPDLFLPVGANTRATIFGRYSTGSFEVSELDGDRYSAGIDLRRGLGARSSLALRLSTEKVEYDNQAVNTDYDSRTGVLVYEVTGNRTGILAEGGYSQIDYRSENRNYPRAILQLTRTLSRTTRLTARAGTRVSDVGEGFRNVRQFFVQGDSGQASTGTSEPFEEKFGFAEVRTVFPRTEFGAGVNVSQERYETGFTFDRDRTTLAFDFTRLLSARVSARLSASYTDEEYLNADSQSEQLFLNAGLDWRLSRTFAVEFSFERTQRRGSSADFQGDENFVSVSVRWEPRGERRRRTPGASGSRSGPPPGQLPQPGAPSPVTPSPTAPAATPGAPPPPPSP